MQMDNTDIKIVPLGYLESYVNIEYDSWDFEATTRTGKWSHTGVARPILPAKEGTYIWKATRQLTFFDANRNPLMALDEFGFPPMGSAEGKLLFQAKKNLPVLWFAD
jgi:hypothetical protein